MTPRKKARKPRVRRIVLARGWSNAWQKGSPDLQWFGRFRACWITDRPCIKADERCTLVLEVHPRRLR